MGVQPVLLSVSLGVIRARSKRLPTRTMKNSSRLLEKIEINFSRSNAGTFGSAASSSTRRSKRSQLSSRFWVYRYCFSVFFGINNLPERHIC